MMKKVLKIALIVFCCMIVVGIGGIFYLSKHMPVVEVGSIDLANVSDGSYVGEYKAFPVTAVVRVDVANHQIATITIEKHDCGKGEKAEMITEDVLKAQSLDVDVVSGATLSSKVILKAVEVALTDTNK